MGAKRGHEEPSTITDGQSDDGFPPWRFIASSERHTDALCHALCYVNSAMNMNPFATNDGRPTARRSPERSVRPRFPPGE